MGLPSRSIPLDSTDFFQGANFDLHSTPIRVELTAGGLPPIMGQSQSLGEGDDSPRPRYCNIHPPRELEEDPSVSVILSGLKVHFILALLSSSSLHYAPHIPLIFFFNFRLAICARYLVLHNVYDELW